MRRETTYNEVFDAQRYFRLLMDSMAHPGKINNLYSLDVLPPEGLNKASALVAMSLLNADVSFCSIAGNRSEITSYILLNTSASPAEVEMADFLFVEGASEGSEIVNAKTGTLLYPEEGASLVITVEAVSQTSVDGAVEITTSGPGVQSATSFFIKGLHETILKNFVLMNAEFPLGIDAIFADHDNNIVCIPRSNKISWKTNVH